MNIARGLLISIGLVLLAGCATGSSIPNGSAHSPTSEAQVQLFTDAPASYKTLGLIQVESEAGMSDQDSVDFAVAELKEQSLKLGANGVLLTSLGYQSVGVSTVRDEKGHVISSRPIEVLSVEGKAIAVH